MFSLFLCSGKKKCAGGSPQISAPTISKDDVKCETISIKVFGWQCPWSQVVFIEDFVKMSLSMLI